MALFDADVGIEILRLRPQALQWFAGLTEAVSVPGYVTVELFAGCRNKQEGKEVENFLADLPLEWGTPQGMATGLFSLFPLMFSHGLSGFDPMIASVALETDETLYTFNRKHFSVIPGLKMQVPYKKI